MEDGSRRDLLPVAVTRPRWRAVGENKMSSLSDVDRGLGEAREGATLARQETGATESEVMFNPKEYFVERSGGSEKTAPNDADAPERARSGNPHKSQDSTRQSKMEWPRSMMLPKMAAPQRSGHAESLGTFALAFAGPGAAAVDAACGHEDPPA